MRVSLVTTCLRRQESYVSLSFPVNGIHGTGRRGDEAYFNMTLPISVLLLISQPWSRKV